MMKSLRLLALTAAFSVTVGVGAARAQSVVVRQAPPGSNIEVVLNSAVVGSTKADAAGDARLPLNLSTHIGKTEIDANVYVDACENLRRVVIAERGSQLPAPQEGCERREVSGLFHVRRVTTLVVNVGAQNPTLLLIQGSYSLGPQGPPRVWPPAPGGLVLFGGGGFATFRDAVAVACGNVGSCGGDSAFGAYTAGVTYWFIPYLAAEVSYLKPTQLSVDGSGATYRFTTNLDAHVATVAGKIGVPIGPVRLYGQIGGNFHRAVSGTTQTIDDATVTIDGVTQTIPGGTQTFELETAGWGWVFGGGLEAWVTRSFGLYAEAGRAALKGTETNDGEAVMDDGVTSLVIGARIRIGR
jgi:hypothetical protein